MRTVSVSIALTENTRTNGGLMIMPGSHRTFLRCAGETPQDNYKNRCTCIVAAGTPDQDSVLDLARRRGRHRACSPGRAGSATWFDSNCMHGSAATSRRIRANVFIVFNSVENVLGTPFGAPAPRPTYIASRDFTPVPR